MGISPCYKDAYHSVKDVSLPEDLAVKTYGGNGDLLHASLISTQDGGGLSASRCDSFAPEKDSSEILQSGGWVDYTAVGEQKTSSPTGIQTPVVQA